MDKAEFMERLRRALAGKLPDEELSDVLSYYEEYFADAGADGEEAAAGLGSPESVAEQVLEGRLERPRTPPVQKPKKHRRWLIALCICAALIFALVAAVWIQFGMRMRELVTAGMQTGGISSHSPLTGRREWEGELEPFSELSIDVGIGDIRVEEGDDWHLSLTSGGQDRSGTLYELDYSLNGDSLEIWSTPESISGDGSPEAEVVLTVPEGTVLNRAEVSIGVGSLDWSGCAVEELLRTEAGVGGLTVTAAVGSAVLTTGVGDVELNAEGVETDYAYQLTTGTGGIRLNGEREGPLFAGGGSGKKNLALSSGTGDISLNFTQ